MEFWSLDILRLILLLFAFAARSDARTCRPTIHQYLSVVTTSGKLLGHQAVGVNNVAEFLGIPYAQPPVGVLRFAAPAKFTSKAVHEASKWGFDCPQNTAGRATYPGLTIQAQRIINSFAAGDGNTQSEDCLTLNIWSKQSRTKNRAVLVFISGGRFTISSVNSTTYNGKYLAAAEDVVVVTFNYRLNVFGFPGVPDQPQNLGLRDQRMAVQWVHDNIANFGGDPTRITLFGQSSGGVSADWWSYAYEEAPLINGIISQSGNVFSFPNNNGSIVERNWYNISDQLGCGSSGDTLNCMRTKSWKDIKAATGRIRPIPGGSPVRSTAPFYPSVDNETVFNDYISRSRAGHFARVPLFLGNNDNEQGYYVIPAYANGINVTKAQGDRFLLESFTCPNLQQAYNRASYDVPVWLYRHFGDWDNLRLYSGSGAYHGTELFSVFGTAEDVSGISSSESQKRTIRTMQHAWAAFARNPRSGLTNELGWPTFDPTRRNLVRLGLDKNVPADLVQADIYDAPCSTIMLGSQATVS